MNFCLNFFLFELCTQMNELQKMWTLRLRILLKSSNFVQVISSLYKNKITLINFVYVIQSRQTSHKLFRLVRFVVWWTVIAARKVRSGRGHLHLSVRGCLCESALSGFFQFESVFPVGCLQQVLPLLLLVHILRDGFQTPGNCDGL